MEDDTINWKTQTHHHHPEKKSSLIPLLLSGALAAGAIGAPAAYLGGKMIENMNKSHEIEPIDNQLTIEFIGGEDG